MLHQCFTDWCETDDSKWSLASEVQNHRLELPRHSTALHYVPTLFSGQLEAIATGGRTNCMKPYEEAKKVETPS
jgi:hypothetical protein